MELEEPHCKKIRLDQSADREQEAVNAQADHPNGKLSITKGAESGVTVKNGCGSDAKLGLTVNDKHLHSTCDAIRVDEADDACANERIVGMHCRVSACERFSGMLKQRYDDFDVREYDMNANPVRLTEREPPKPIAEAPKVLVGAQSAEATKEEETQEAEETATALAEESSSLPEELISKVRDFLSKGGATSELPEEATSELSAASELSLVVENDKQKRGEMHRQLKLLFSGIDANTIILENGDKVITIRSSSSKQKRHDKHFNKWDKPGRRRDASGGVVRPKYCQFVLFKQNLDTMAAISLLAKFTRTSASRFGYAGTKDKRASTVQLVTVSHFPAEKLALLSKRIRNMALGNFTYSDRPIALGDLSGNEFGIVIRDVTVSDEIVNKALGSLHDSGFLNYFGLQRFGTGSAKTHEVGKALLTRNWDEAVDLILQENENDQDELREAKRIWKETRNAEQALKALDIRRRESVENKLLQGLSSSSAHDYLSAIQKIPRNTRMMYLHSWQSYVWNHALSRRMQLFGMKPVAGDLVLTEKRGVGAVRSADIGACVSRGADCKFNDEGKHLTGTITSACEQDGWVNVQWDDVQMRCRVGAENSFDLRYAEAVHVLSDEDISSGRYSIEDVALPLPGYDIRYPEHAVVEYYQELLSADGIDIENMRNKVKELSLSGKYRRICIKPKNMSWNIIGYNDFTKSIMPNDLEKLTNQNAEDMLGVYEPDHSSRYKAVKLHFLLPPSTYATVALREVLNVETSFAEQMKLHENFMKKDSSSMVENE